MDYRDEQIQGAMTAGFNLSQGSAGANANVSANVTAAESIPDSIPEKSLDRPIDSSDVNANTEVDEDMVESLVSKIIAHEKNNLYLGLGSHVKEKDFKEMVTLEIREIKQLLGITD